MLRVLALLVVAALAGCIAVDPPPDSRRRSGEGEGEGEGEPAEGEGEGEGDGEACSVPEDCTALVYTACSCDVSDPCGWVDDGVCDEVCATIGGFDDAADCAPPPPPPPPDPCRVFTECFGRTMAAAPSTTTGCEEAEVVLDAIRACDETCPDGDCAACTQDTVVCTSFYSPAFTDCRAEQPGTTGLNCARECRFNHYCRNGEAARTCGLSGLPPPSDCR